MGISTLSGTMTANWKWSAGNNLVGTDYSPTTNQGAINKQQTFSTATNNNLLGGADEFVSYLFTIANSANATVNCQSLTNILQQSGIALARIKGYMIRLLSITDDTVNGTNCSSINFGNAATNSQQLNLTANSACIVNNGGDQSYFDQTNAGFLVTNSARNIFFVNNDSGNAACVQLSLACATT